MNIPYNESGDNVEFPNINPVRFDKQDGLWESLVKPSIVNNIP